MNSEKSILQGKFVFKSEDVAVCSICGKKFKFHRSYSTLKYHLRNKHPFVDMANKTIRQASTHSSDVELIQASNVQQVPVLRQLRIDEIGKKMDKDKSEKITKALASWMARNGRPINIISDEGLQDVIRVALPLHKHSLDLPSDTE